MSCEAVPIGARPTSELVAVAGWTAAALMMTGYPLLADAPVAAVPSFIAVSVAFAGWNALRVGRAWRWRLNLLARRPWQVPAADAATIARDSVHLQWLGRGFDWTPAHSQRMRTLLRTEPAHLAPPRWLQSIAAGAGAQVTPGHGIRLIDGVESTLRPVRVPLAALASHTLVFGQTGAGKTRFAELIVTSFLARHPEAVVFVLDPKGDRGLRSTLERACDRAGRPEAFISLHPAFPAASIRFDPLRNFARTTSIATRIASLLPASGGGDAFTQFAWRALYRVAEAMVYAGVRPSLAGLRHCLEDDAHPLLAQALACWIGSHDAARAGTAAPGVSGAAAAPPAASAGRVRPRDAATGRARAPQFEPGLAAAVARYRDGVRRDPALRVAAIDGLLSLVLHDPTHFSKMIQNLLPLLTALTAGELGPLLSPDAGTRPDPRPVFDARKVIEQRRCLYIGLDSLTDATVGAALGAIALADLAQVAGEIFNHGQGMPVPVLVFVDEAAEVVNQPLIQLLNKSRGAGFTLYLAAQTVHDYEARMGSAAAARMLLGNPGNLIALRTTDRETQRFCTEGVVQTEVDMVGESRTVGMRAGDADAGLSGAIGTRRDRREAELFAPEWLGLMPDLHFLARIAGGRTIKGELPLLTEAGQPRA